MALGVGGGHVWAVASSSNPGVSIFGSPVDEDAWTASSLTLTVGAGGAPGFQIVLTSDLGWIVDNDRATLPGASLQDGLWKTWAPPCLDGKYGDGQIAAVSTRYLVAFCPPSGYLDPPSPAALFASTNGGETFQPVAATLPSSLDLLSASPSGVLFCFDTQGIAASFDHGATWRTVLDIPGNQPINQDVGIAFVTPAVGYATTSLGKLFKTVDGGNSWQAVSLPST